ncbi:hypothetical protein C6P46_000040 [Rhodotorula mucilaginosa]|uniref:Uncharacterized protein n=1 Tax=Rhodotorula mucilaginosa TaxID=5537 RepID=A0A9P7BAM0_RHOMI|nr:hypothetical protein C6P46_000040 [Rhodotorula mucilaginosa]TKA57358.1 hypothetical protein B0A53_00587 [Rhodotorula sp. CCFEE 5036]
MSTAVAIPMPMSPLDQRHMPVLSTLDPSFSPSTLHLQPYTNPTRSPCVRGGSPVMRASPTPSMSTTKSDSFREDVFATGSSADRSTAVPMGSRHERVPYDGPGTAVARTMGFLAPQAARTTTKIPKTSLSSTSTGKYAVLAGFTSIQKQVRATQAQRNRAR